MSQGVNHARSVAAILTDMQSELRQFVETRIAMFRTEIRDKANVLKVAAPLAAAGILFLITGYFLFMISLVGLVFAFLPNNAFRWCMAFLVVAIFCSIVGGLATYFAKRELEPKGLLPSRTLGVLKGDKAWLRSEVKTQI